MEKTNDLSQITDKLYHIKLIWTVKSDEIYITILIGPKITGNMNFILWMSGSKTDHHAITEILLKVALNTINQPTNHQSCIE
jgi:hypothetical protein